jgi:hypothetical protein
MLKMFHLWYKEIPLIQLILSKSSGSLDGIYGINRIRSNQINHNAEMFHLWYKKSR